MFHEVGETQESVNIPQAPYWSSATPDILIFGQICPNLQLVTFTMRATTAGRLVSLLRPSHIKWRLKISQESSAVVTGEIWPWPGHGVSQWHLVESMSSAGHSVRSRKKALLGKPSFRCRSFGAARQWSFRRLLPARAFPRSFSLSFWRLPPRTRVNKSGDTVQLHGRGKTGSHVYFHSTVNGLKRL